jgi:hypothetical protein
MQFIEVILVEVVKKPARADRVLRDLQVVNVVIPVLADFRRRRHVTTIHS